MKAENTNEQLIVNELSNIDAEMENHVNNADIEIDAEMENIQEIETDEDILSINDDLLKKMFKHDVKTAA